MGNVYCNLKIMLIIFVNGKTAINDKRNNLT